MISTTNILPLSQQRHLKELCRISRHLGSGIVQSVGLKEQAGGIATPTPSPQESVSRSAVEELNIFSTSKSGYILLWHVGRFTLPKSEERGTGKRMSKRKQNCWRRCRTSLVGIHHSIPMRIWRANLVLRTYLIWCNGNKRKS